MGGWKGRGRGRVEMRGDEEGSEWRGDGTRLGGGGCEYIWGIKVEMQLCGMSMLLVRFLRLGTVYLMRSTG